MKKKLGVFLIIFFIFGCGAKIIRTQYVNKNVKISKNDEILILPTVVIKDVKTGIRGLESMFDTLVFVKLKSSGNDVIASEEIFKFLDEKKIGIEDIKKVDFKDIRKEIRSELGEKFNCKYFLKVNIIEHAKDDLLTENKIFVSLKVYLNNGDEIVALSDHYQGDEGISSSDIYQVLEGMVEELVKTQGK